MNYLMHYDGKELEMVLPKEAGPITCQYGLLLKPTKKSVFLWGLQWDTRAI